MNSFSLSAKIEKRPAGHLVVSSTEFTTDGETTVGGDDVPVSIHLDRVVLMLLEWIVEDEQTFATNITPWDKLKDEYRKSATPGWLKGVFGSRERWKRLVSRESNGDFSIGHGFDKASVSISLTADGRKLPPPEAYLHLLRELAICRLPKGAERFAMNEAMNTLRLSSETASELGRIAAGKVCWLVKLSELEDLLTNEILGIAFGSFLSELAMSKENGISRDAVKEFTTKIHVAIFLLDTRFSDAATAAGVSIADLVARLRTVQKAVNAWHTQYQADRIKPEDLEAVEAEGQAVWEMISEVRTDLAARVEACRKQLIHLLSSKPLAS